MKESSLKYFILGLCMYLGLEFHWQLLEVHGNFWKQGPVAVMQKNISAGSDNHISEYFASFL